MRDYEHAGEAVIRFLALESRVPSLAPILAFGRAGHHSWVERTFPAALAGLAGPERELRLLLLICATDVYTWHLLRRGQGLTRRGTAAAISELVEALHIRNASEQDRHPRSLDVKPQSFPGSLRAAARRSPRRRGCGS
jgi:hypothetical protein